MRVKPSTLAIMQPYFMPYIGYFQLIAASDLFIAFDTAQYIRHGWVNRNRILHPTEGWQYVIAPLRKHAREAAIRDVMVQEGPEWARKLMAQMAHYKKRGPHYGEVIALLESELLPLCNTEITIAKLNVALLRAICKRLGINTPIEVYSEMGLQIADVSHAGQWALRISEAIGAKRYINPPGGRDIFNPDEFKGAGIELRFLEPGEIAYDQGGRGFEPWLSILDLMIWNSTDEIMRHLESFSLVE